jgi:hypothetical protein
MFHLNKRKIIITFSICLFLSATEVFACECPILSTDDAFENSTLVFTGKVVGFEYRKGIPNQFIEWAEKHSGKPIEYETMVVKFKVERYWKGEAPQEIFLVTSRTKNADGTSSSSSCDYDFKEGESYLIYAADKGRGLRTNFCMRTRPLIRAEEDLKILREGKKPVEKRDEPSISGHEPEITTFLKIFSFNSRLCISDFVLPNNIDLNNPKSAIPNPKSL